jgi:hypothetical protein
MSSARSRITVTHHDRIHGTSHTDTHATIAYIAIATPRIIEATLSKSHMVNTHSHTLTTILDYGPRGRTSGDHEIIHIILRHTIPPITSIQLTLLAAVPTCTRSLVIGTITIIMSIPLAITSARAHGNKSTPILIQIFRLAEQSIVTGIQSIEVITGLSTPRESYNDGGGPRDLDAGSVTGGFVTQRLVGTFAGQAGLALIGVD